MEDVKIKTTPQIATLRSGAFQKVEDPTEGEVVAKEVKVADDVIKAKVTESVKEIAEMINLEEAEVIVSGGRFQRLKPFIQWGFIREESMKQNFRMLFVR